MIILSLNTDTFSCDNRCDTTVYNLLANSEQYEIECYIAGANSTDSRNYCKVPKLIEPQQKLETLLYFLANRNIAPLHIRDIIEDFLS